MKILIIGGSGFIGKEIVQQLLRAGHVVTLFNRSVTSPDINPPAIRGDVEDLLRYRADILALKPEVVVHCIAYSEKNARDCVDVFQGSSARIIVLGSMDCYDVFQAANRGQEVSDFTVDERMPTTPIRHYWRGFQHHRADDYGKNLMTDVFMKAGAEGKIFPATILRRRGAGGLPTWYNGD